MRVSIIGGGGWGLALAKLLAENQHEVLVWEFDSEFLSSLKQNHGNPVLLKDLIQIGRASCRERV